MANIKLLILALAFGANSAHALYVTPSTPENWKIINGVGHLSISPSDTSFANGIRSKIAGGAARVALGSGAVDIPVAYKFAATAGKVAASLAFGWPGAFLLAGGLAYQWFTDNGCSVSIATTGASAGLPVWKCQKEEVVTGFLWTASDSGLTYQNMLPLPVCGWLWVQIQGAYYGKTLLNTTFNPFPAPATSGNCEYHLSDGSTRYWTISQQPGSSVSFVDNEVTQTELEDKMQPHPVPLGVPQAWPSSVPMWWPVQNPILNPTEENPADPSAVPLPTPLRVPQGDPVAVPNTSPQKYTSPVIDIYPSPTLADPWRVDVQPKDVTTLSPDPLVPAPVPLTPVPDVDVTPADRPVEKTQEQIDLCKLYPDILGCATPELDTPVEDPLETQPRDVSFSPQSGWGGGAGSCPAPRHLAGANLDFTFDLACDFMSGIKPVLLAVAGLAAGMIIIGARGGAAE